MELAIRCPATGARVPVGFMGPGPWDISDATVHCLACGESHLWTTHEDGEGETAFLFDSPRTRNLA